MSTKYTCAFCAKSNTKMEAIHQGFWGTHVGDKEVIDSNAPEMMRCSNMSCGKILHEKCLRNLDKYESSFFGSGKYSCPACDSKMVTLKEDKSWF